MLNFDRERSYTQRQAQTPPHVYEIPCAMADGGSYYCQPYQFARDGDDTYAYVVVDTKKLLQRIATDNPHLLEHGQKWKYNPACDSPEAALKRNSKENPDNMGTFGFSDLVGETRDKQSFLSRLFFGKSKGTSEPGIEMNTGDAAMIRTIEELGLPYVPIAVPKQQAAQFQKLLGYSAPITPLSQNLLTQEL